MSRHAPRREAPSSLDVALGVLAVLRVHHLLTHDRWPPVEAARSRYLERVGAESVWSDLALCGWCQSLWLGPLVAFALGRWPGVRWLLLGPAISAGVGLLSTLDSYLGSDSDLGTLLEERVRGRAGSAS